MNEPSQYKTVDQRANNSSYIQRDNSYNSNQSRVCDVSKTDGLSTTRLMKIMNKQIQDVRNEFIGVIKDMVMYKAEQANHEQYKTDNSSSQSQFQTVNQLQNPNREQYYSPDQYNNKFNKEEESMTYDNRKSKERKLYDKNNYYIDNRRQSYNPNLHDLPKEDYSTNESSNRMHPIIKSASSNNFIPQNAKHVKNKPEFAKIEDISAVSDNKSLNLGTVPCTK